MEFGLDGPRLHHSGAEQADLARVRDRVKGRVGFRVRVRARVRAQSRLTWLGLGSGL